MHSIAARRERFDEGYYRRFYFDPRTRVISRRDFAQRARMIGALMQHLELPVRRILDAGCGLGWMRAPLLKAFPGAAYVGVEVSEHLCKRHGWIHGSLATFRTRTSFDLIVCHDVIQYLSERDAARAIGNLGAMSRGALYFHAPTLEDWRSRADREASDSEVHLRPAEWYRTRLAKYFRHAGFGLCVRRGAPLMQWALESAEHVSTSDKAKKKRPGRAPA